MKKFYFKRISTLLISLTIILSLIPQVVYGSTTNDAEYDPRGLGIMTPVKDQNPQDVCWSFAGAAALESFLKLKGFGEEDFSEEHARWWATYNEAGYGWNRGGREGGPTQIMPGYLTSWSGPKQENDIPYDDYYYSTKPDNMNNTESKYNVTDIVYINKDSAAVKDAVLTYGAVTTTYYDRLLYTNYSTSAYYCNDENNIANHNVVIVGWNDNYSKENFNEISRPVNNGAWLVKNSWGLNNSEGGYLWISYEDKFILSQSANKINYAIKGVEKVDNNKKLYQYDEYGATSSLYLTNDSGKVQDMTYANVYDFDSEHEILDSIMFNSVNQGAKYSLYYAPIVNNIPELTVDKMLLLGSGIIEEQGYMTVDINDFVLPKGKGAIVVYLDNRENNVPVSLGCEVNLTYAGGKLAYKADAQIGQSYIYSEEQVLDINESFTDSPRNFTIKAITKKSSDNSLGKVEINGVDVTATLNKESYSYAVDLPYSSIDSKATLKVTSQNGNAKIKSINSVVKEMNIGEEEIIIPKSGQVSPVEITCEAADGSVKKYVLNITLAKELNTAADLLKNIEISNKENIDEIMFLNKSYDNLNEIEKAKLPEDIVANILNERKLLEGEFHEDNGIKVTGIPWQVELKVAKLSGNDPSWLSIKNNVTKEKIFGGYDIYLIDHYSNLHYTNSGDEIVLTIPSPIIEGYKNIRVIHVTSNGDIEYFTPLIEGDKLIIKVSSFSPYGIIGEENLKVLNETDDNKVVIEDGKSAQVTSDLSTVRSGDDSSTVIFIILGIISLVAIIFIAIISIKKKNTKR